MNFPSDGVIFTIGTGGADRTLGLATAGKLSPPIIGIAMRHATCNNFDNVKFKNTIFLIEKIIIKNLFKFEKFHFII